MVGYGYEYGMYIVCIWLVIKSIWYEKFICYIIFFFGKSLGVFFVYFYVLVMICVYFWWVGCVWIFGYWNGLLFKLIIFLIYLIIWLVIYFNM